MITEIIITLINSLNIRFVYSDQMNHLFNIMLSYSTHDLQYIYYSTSSIFYILRVIYDLRQDKLLLGMI